MSERRAVAILGAGGSLGSAISARLAAEADTDLVLSDLSAEALEATLAGLPAGASAATVPADIGEADEVKAVIDATLERFGRLDVVISNAGVPSPNGRIHNLTDEVWERSLRVNVMGAVHAIAAAVGPMRKQQKGSIILTASVAGMTAWTHAAPYCVTKAAVIHLTKVAALEYARDGIRVNCVCPGTFVSAMHAELPPEAIEAIAARHPLGLGAPADLVGAFAYLASEEAGWTTGAALVVDGGYAAP